MRNTRLDELHFEIKISERNINNHKYVDDTTQMSGRQEELKCFLTRVKEDSERSSLKVNI